MSWAEIKNALNSTVGTEKFQSLDEMIETVMGMFYGKITILQSRTFTVPDGVKKLYISGCGAGGNGTNGSNGGKAGQYVFQEEVSVNPGDVFTITVGTGNTVISSTGGYSKTLTANSIATEYHNNFIGWETGYNGFASDSGGKGGYGGAFGFGGGGGGNGVRNSSDYGHGGNGGSVSGGETPYTPSLTYGAKGTDGKGGNVDYDGGDGGDAGGYGAGGGECGSGRYNGEAGKGSQGIVIIQWGTLQ